MKWKEFVKKNRFFVFLLSIMCIIIISLLGYMGVRSFLQENKPSENTPFPSSTNEKAEISSFEGIYVSSSQKISLYWKLDKNDSTILSAYLYYNDTQIDEVTNKSSYDLPLDLYNISTGINTFILEVNLNDGETLKSSVNVKVNYVLSMEQSVEQKDNSTVITLTYVYQNDSPVGEPSIICMDDAVNCNLCNYVGTTKETSGNKVVAKTTYEFLWGDYPVEYGEFSVRWIFNDVHENSDFVVQKGVPIEESDE